MLQLEDDSVWIPEKDRPTIRVVLTGRGRHSDDLAHELDAALAQVSDRGFDVVDLEAEPGDAEATGSRVARDRVRRKDLDDLASGTDERQAEAWIVDAAADLLEPRAAALVVVGDELEPERLDVELQ